MDVQEVRVDIDFGDLVCGLKDMFVVFKMLNFYLETVLYGDGALWRRCSTVALQWRSMPQGQPCVPARWGPAGACKKEDLN